MKKLQFAITINVPKEKVWHTMLDDITYKQWASVFSPGSYYQWDWSNWSKMLFLGTDPNTWEQGGMISIVTENKPYEFISLLYTGMIMGDQEDTTSELSKKWTDWWFENYTFDEKNGITELIIDLNVADDLAWEFEKMWPDALKVLKDLSEEIK